MSNEGMDRLTAFHSRPGHGKADFVSGVTLQSVSMHKRASCGSPLQSDQGSKAGLHG